MVFGMHIFRNHELSNTVVFDRSLLTSKDRDEISTFVSVATLVVSETVSKSPPDCAEPECSLPRPQQPATSPYRQPN